MPISEYYLYRIKLIKSSQTRMFVEDLSPSDIFKKILEEKPSITLRENKMWHIGNIEYFDENTGVFAIGRTSKTTVEKYDNESGDFIEELNDSSPYTLVVFDKSLGVLGIGKKTKVAPSTNSIAKRMKSIFECSQIVNQLDVDVNIDAIYDPEQFINKINKAYSIKQFKMWFMGPNPIDADEYFNKPLSNMSTRANADKGTLELNSENDSLKKDMIEQLAKSTASLGNRASAKIQPEDGYKSISIQLKGDIAKMVAKTSVPMKNIVNELLELYSRIKN